MDHVLRLGWNQVINKTSDVLLNSPNMKNGRNIKKVNDEQYIPDEYKKFAHGMEKQFVEFMIDQMKKTVPGQEKDDSATKYYKSLMNSERAEVMSSKNGGMGVKTMILDQIYPKNKRSKFAYNQYLKMKNDQQKTLGRNEINIDSKELKQPIQIKENDLNGVKIKSKTNNNKIQIKKYGNKEVQR